MLPQPKSYLEKLRCLQQTLRPGRMKGSSRNPARPEIDGRRRNLPGVDDRRAANARISSLLSGPEIPNGQTRFASIATLAVCKTRLRIFQR